jgi:hypothetical protein
LSGRPKQLPQPIPEAGKIGTGIAIETSALQHPDAGSERMGEITELLARWRLGSTDAGNELFNLVNANLRRLAHYVMRGEREGHFLETTELVDQIYIRLVAIKDRDWQSRQHFFAIAARSMRRYLIARQWLFEHMEQANAASKAN